MSELQGDKDSGIDIVVSTESEISSARDSTESSIKVQSKRVWQYGIKFENLCHFLSISKDHGCVSLLGCGSP